jgi:hypothetical protein
MPIPRTYARSGNTWRIVRSRAEARRRLNPRDRSWPPAACKGDDWIGDDPLVRVGSVVPAGRYHPY